LDSAAFARKQHRRRERRKSQVGRGEALASEKAAAVTQLFLHVSKNTPYAVE
jgi:hypothetical protein